MGKTCKKSCDNTTSNILSIFDGLLGGNQDTYDVKYTTSTQTPPPSSGVPSGTQATLALPNPQRLIVTSVLSGTPLIGVASGTSSFDFYSPDGLIMNSYSISFPVGSQVVAAVENNTSGFLIGTFPNQAPASLLFSVLTAGGNSSIYGYGQTVSAFPQLLIGPLANTNILSMVIAPINGNLYLGDFKVGGTILGFSGGLAPLVPGFVLLNPPTNAVAPLALKVVQDVNGDYKLAVSFALVSPLNQQINSPFVLLATFNPDGNHNNTWNPPNDPNGKIVRTISGVPTSFFPNENNLILAGSHGNGQLTLFNSNSVGIPHGLRNSTTGTAITIPDINDFTFTTVSGEQRMYFVSGTSEYGALGYITPHKNSNCHNKCNDPCRQRSDSCSSSDSDISLDLSELLSSLNNCGDKKNHHKKHHKKHHKDKC